MTSADEDIVVATDGAVRIVTLNRPDARNAFSEPMHHQFARTIAALDDDDTVRAVVLTGAGRSFCAGGSLDDFEIKRTDFEVRRQSLRDARRLVDEMLNFRVPVVAAVNGAAVGLGCTLVTLCDVVFMSANAFLADPHVAVALVAGDGGAVTWPFHTSLLHAKQYLLTGDRISANEALRIGLANFVVDGSRLLTEATAFARRLAALPPQAVQDTKAILNQHLRQSAVSVLGYGLAAESQSHDTTESATSLPEDRVARVGELDPPHEQIRTLVWRHFALVDARQDTLAVADLYTDDAVVVVSASSTARRRSEIAASTA